jgi:NADH:ubiquinone oxidoreductase subunit K
MKFNIITLIWSIALMLLTFNVCMLAIDWQFTNTLVYKFMLLINGFMFGLVINEWSNNA